LKVWRARKEDDQKTSTRKKRYFSITPPHQFDSGLPQTAALGRSAEMAKMRRLK